MDGFTTSRLRASRLAREHLPALVELHLDPDVTRFLGGVRTPEATAEYVETNIRHWDEYGVGLWALHTSDDIFVGRAGLRYVDVEGKQELEIAYTLARKARGQGYATEVATALTERWSAGRTEPSLVGIVMKQHSASEHVLAKCGFSYERDAQFHGATCGVFRRVR